MQKACKKMCNQCPWRKNSAEGWLGAASPQDFVLAIQQSGKLPCHSSVDYESDDWKSKIEDDEILHCAGAILAAKKMCKIPLNSEHANLIAKAQRDENHMNHHEFIEHHENAKLKSWNM